MSLEAKAEEIEVFAPPVKVTPLEFLEAVYMNPNLKDRIKAAVEAAPYVHPRLKAVLQLGPDLKDELRQARERLNRVGVRMLPLSEAKVRRR